MNEAASLHTKLMERSVHSNGEGLLTEVKVSRNGPERISGKRIIAGTAFRLEFLAGWYYDADADT